MGSAIGTGRAVTFARSSSCFCFALPLFWLHIRCILEHNVPVNLSIKNAPDDVVRRLRARAARHHRSLQGELMAILEEAVGPSRLTPEEVLSKVRQLGLSTPGDAAAMVREDRDGR
jgi:plasmid stability protein